MNRRTFIAATMGAAMSPAAHAAQMVIGPATYLGVPSRAWVARPAIVRQQCPEWCWAASASMIFAALGHPVDQKTIVSRVFGGLACAPAGQTLTMAKVLSAAWVDDSGQQFQSSVTAAYDPMNGVLAINNAIIANELQQDRPLLYANTHHAMVVAEVDYLATPMGPNVQAVGVLDPWPYSPPFHPLTPPEMIPAHMGGQMTFLAAVDVY